MTDDLIPCSSGCSRSTADPLHLGWEFLSISQRWRCPQCCRELWEVNARPPITLPHPGEPAGA